MTDDHGQTQELLAGYVLQGLSGDDAAEADRLLTEHVPTCPECRMMLDAFQAIAGELALDAEPVPPPDPLLPRIHREMEPRGRSGGRWSPARLVAVAASVVLVVGAGGLVLTQRGGDGLVSGDALTRADIHDVANAAVSSGATQHDLGQHHATEISSPETEKLYVYGADVPMPPPGTVYRLWAVTAGQPDAYIGDFLPGADGTVILAITLGSASVGQLLVTIESAGSTPTTPGEPAWASAS